MENVNRSIVGSVIIITAAGLYHYFLGGGGTGTKTTITRIIVGGFMLGLIASFFEFFGFGVDKVAGYILMLAVAVAAFTVISDLVTRYTNQQQAQESSTVTQSGGGGNTKK